MLPSDIDTCDLIFIRLANWMTSSVVNVCEEIVAQELLLINSKKVH